MVLINKDAGGGASGSSGLQMMQQQFDEVVIQALSSETYTEIDGRIEFGYHNRFIQQLTEAMYQSQNFARSSTAAIVPMMKNLRGVAVAVLKKFKGQLEGRHVTFWGTERGVMLALNGGDEYRRAAWEEFMGLLQVINSFTVPNISPISLAIEDKDVQVSHDIFSKVAIVAKEAGAVIKPRRSDEEACLIQILKTTGKLCLRLCHDVLITFS